ncbi:protein of unknown function [Clostridium beijerinckii]|nr:protein of unknown function [Clostridium beijerinckii]
MNDVRWDKYDKTNITIHKISKKNNDDYLCPGSYIFNSFYTFYQSFLFWFNN